MDPIPPISQAKVVDKGRSQSGFPFDLYSALSSKDRRERTGPILRKPGKAGAAVPWPYSGCSSDTGLLAPQMGPCPPLGRGIQQGTDRGD